jgi:hypothetical protein
MTTRGGRTVVNNVLHGHGGLIHVGKAIKAKMLKIQLLSRVRARMLNIGLRLLVLVVCRVKWQWQGRQQ